jgi:hypothetical protein
MSRLGFVETLIDYDEIAVFAQKAKVVYEKFLNRKKS